MILAAGMGSRLAHITKDTPKCLVEVGGKPIIFHVISALRKIGISEFVVNLHYKAEMVHSYLETLQKDPSLTIHFSRETSLLDTGGGLLHASSYFQDCEKVLIHNADIYSEVSFEEMVRVHENQSALATLYTKKAEDPRTLLFSKEGELLGWQNADTGDKRLIRDVSQTIPLGFCGVSLISRGFFEYLDGHGEKFSLISAFLRAAEDGERVQSYEDNDSFWIDMGTPEKLEVLRKRLT